MQTYTQEHRRYSENILVTRGSLSAWYHQGKVCTCRYRTSWRGSHSSSCLQLSQISLSAYQERGSIRLKHSSCEVYLILLDNTAATAFLNNVTCTCTQLIDDHLKVFVGRQWKAHLLILVTTRALGVCLVSVTVPVFALNLVNEVPSLLRPLGFLKGQSIVDVEVFFIPGNDGVSLPAEIVLREYLRVQELRLIVLWDEKEREI